MAHADKELLQAWCQGDLRAGERLYHRHYASIARFFRTKLGEGHDDLVQITFVYCVESIADYRGDASFRTYLFGIARNVLLQHLRSKQREAARIDPRSVSMAVASAHSFTSMIAAGRQHDRLLLALRELPIDTQMMIELHYWEGLTIQEIAQVVELPLSTVKTRMRRGRLRLCEVLG